MKVKSIIISFSLFISLKAQSFSIARVHYGGGGDWYSNPSSLPNLLSYLKSNTPISVYNDEVRIKLTDENLSQYPYMYLNGHGNIKLSNKEIIALRSSLLNGGFLHADDNYGMDKSFRREMKKVFPSKKFIPLPDDHPIFNSYFYMPDGLPKIHEHDNKPAQALALFEKERIIVLYTYESDLGDGWEDQSVHNNPPNIRLKALQMGANIIGYVMDQNSIK